MAKAAGHDIFMRVTWTDDQALCQALLPFVQGTGLFITREQLGSPMPTLGDRLHLLLQIAADGGCWPLIGRVIWCCPLGAYPEAGIGVQLTGSDTNHMLEAHLTRVCSVEPMHSDTVV